MQEKVKRFRNPCQVRWLSTHDAVEKIYLTWTALILELEHEAALETNEYFVFIAIKTFLLDVLGFPCKPIKFLNILEKLSY